jgi:large subunit ribosomal protein L24
MGVNVNVKKGDEVLVIAGKDKGRRGKVQKVIPSDNAVIIEGLNFVKKHAKPNKANPQGGVIDKALPLNISKVMVVCSGCNQPTRSLKEQAVDGQSVRKCRHCGRILD